MHQSLTTSEVIMKISTEAVLSEKWKFKLANSTDRKVQFSDRILDYRIRLPSGLLSEIRLLTLMPFRKCSGLVLTKVELYHIAPRSLILDYVSPFYPTLRFPIHSSLERIEIVFILPLCILHTHLETLISFPH